MQGHAHRAKNSFTFIEENETDELPQLRTKHEMRRRVDTDPKRTPPHYPGTAKPTKGAYGSKVPTSHEADSDSKSSP
ncbi:hypothetical protein F2Q69_00005221 [Brassica cretica]|uniref:Uncharacterized protein n=1 Tax=Brassica cretica TaxID=69181 RepID=A0A8S9P2H3_BRACR|nr:hypothetical protein F2Q69_00005221 [Brassica cretica]